MSRLSISPVKPTSEFTPMISKEVPVATFIGKPAIITRAGIIINPPPAPTSPVSRPIKRPSIIRKSTLCEDPSRFSSFLPLIIENEVRIMSTAKSPSNSSRFEKVNEEIVNKTSGIEGTSHFRVAKMERREGSPNVNAVFKSTSPFAYFGGTPTMLADPTRKRE